MGKFTCRNKRCTPWLFGLPLPKHRAKANIDQQIWLTACSGFPHSRPRCASIRDGDRSDIRALPMMRAPLWKRPAVFVWERIPCVDSAANCSQSTLKIATAARQDCSCLPSASDVHHASTCLNGRRKRQNCCPILAARHAETPTPTN
jgi:hypothetical protein